MSVWDEIAVRSKNAKQSLLQKKYGLKNKKTGQRVKPEAMPFSRSSKPDFFWSRVFSLFFRPTVTVCYLVTLL